MKKQMMAICDSDSTYARRFCEYAGRKKEYPFEVAAFSSIKNVKEFLAGRELQVLLLEEGLYEESLFEGLTCQLILLGDRGKPTAIPPVIRKMQSADDIMKEILRIYGESGKEKDNPIVFQEGHMKLLGFYSPVRRSFQTSFALTMGQLLASRHKVLYLNFESFSGFERYFEKEFMTDLSDLIYYVNNAREALFYKLQGMIESIGNLDFIPPAFSYMDINQITSAQWGEMFAEIERLSAYDYVILDLSDNMQGLFEILRQCHQVFTVVQEDGMALAKMEQYRRLLERMDYEDVIDKTKNCKMAFIQNIPGSLREMTHGELAEYVREIMRKELYEAG